MSTIDEQEHKLKRLLKAEHNFARKRSRLAKTNRWLKNPSTTLRLSLPLVIFGACDSNKQYFRLASSFKSSGMWLVHSQKNVAAFTLEPPPVRHSFFEKNPHTASSPNPQDDDNHEAKSDSSSILREDTATRMERISKMMLGMYSNVHLRRALHDGYFAICDQVSESLDDITKCEELKGKVIRLQTTPRSIKETLVKDIPLEIQLHPKTFDHVLYVHQLGDWYFWGITPRELHLTTHPAFKKDAQESHINRAYYKIKEAVEIENLKFDNNSSICLDLGAAPGGWAEYLSTRFHKVVCVDPGALHKKVDELDNVKHIPKKVEDSIEELKEFIIGENRGGFDICVCDTNGHPEMACKLILQIEHLLKPGSHIIWTVKLLRRSFKFLEASIMASFELMNKTFENIQFLWLYANSSRERTMIATKREAA